LEDLRRRWVPIAAGNSRAIAYVSIKTPRSRRIGRQPALGAGRIACASAPLRRTIVAQVSPWSACQDPGKDGLRISGLGDTDDPRD